MTSSGNYPSPSESVDALPNPIASSLIPNLSHQPADIIVFLDSDNKFDKTYDGLLGRMRDLAKICSYVNPKAVMIDCVEPICCTLPIVQAVLMDTNFYNPTRILGCVSPLQVINNARTSATRS